MGAWGTGNFANDDAMDWRYDIEESVAAQGAPDDATFVPLARRVVDAVEERSSIAGLRMDAGTGAEWHGVMAGPRARLQR